MPQFLPGVNMRRTHKRLAVRANVAWPRQTLRRSTSDSFLWFGSIGSLENHWDKDWDLCACNLSLAISSPSTPRATFILEVQPVSNSPPGVEVCTPDLESGLTVEQAIEHDVESGLSIDLDLPHINVASPDDRLIINPGLNREDRPIVGLERRQEMPCVFAWGQEPTSPPVIEYSKLIVQPGSVPAGHIHGHAIIDPTRNSACFRPLTFCSVHKNSGFLKLLDIISSENYTRVEVTHPFSKITHRYNNCVLEFPPTENLIVFRPDHQDSFVTPPPPIVSFPDPPARPSPNPPATPPNSQNPPTRPPPDPIHPSPAAIGSSNFIAQPPLPHPPLLGFYHPIGSPSHYTRSPPPPQVGFYQPTGSSNPTPASASRPRHQGFQLPIGQSKPAPKPVEYQKKFCEECGKPLANLDWYLYRSKIFCRERCRYANTLDAFLLQKPMGYMGSSSGGDNVADMFLNLFEVPLEALPSSSHDNKEDEKGKCVAVENENDEENPSEEECPRKDKGKGILYIG